VPRRLQAVIPRRHGMPFPAGRQRETGTGLYRLPRGLYDRSVVLGYRSTWRGAATFGDSPQKTERLQNEAFTLSFTGLARALWVEEPNAHVLGAFLGKAELDRDVAVTPEYLSFYIRLTQCLSCLLLAPSAATRHLRRSRE